MTKNVSKLQYEQFEHLRSAIIDQIGVIPRHQPLAFFDTATGKQKTVDESMYMFSGYFKYLKQHNKELAEKITLFLTNFFNNDFCDKEYKEVVAAINSYYTTLVCAED